MTLTPRQLHAATVTRLDTHPTLVVFDGEPGEGTNGPVPTAPDGTVNPYAVVWAPTGHGLHTRLGVGASVRRSRLWVTVAGGDTRRCLWALENVEELLDGWAPTGDRRDGHLTQDIDPGPPQVDRDVNPHRLYVASQWAYTAH